jgi:hypothetical protein
MIQIGHCGDTERLLGEEIEVYVRLLKELIERTVEMSLQRFSNGWPTNLLGGDLQKLWLKYAIQIRLHLQLYDVAEIMNLMRTLNFHIQRRSRKLNIFASSTQCSLFHIIITFH